MRWIGRFVGALTALAFCVLAYFYLTLPDVRELREANPSTTAFMELRAGEARAAGRGLQHRWEWVPYERISPHLRRAAVMTEDDAFWQHDGLDYWQIRESIQINLEAREVRRGASTITQQLAKNLYLSPSRDPLRKLRELLITRRLEHELSKERILEIYLNVIEWGDGIWGAEAAARTYFGKPAAELTPAEAALLAGAIINPRLHNPAQPTQRLRARQRLILARLGAGAGASAAAPQRALDTISPTVDEVAPAAADGEGRIWPQ